VDSGCVNTQLLTLIHFPSTCFHPSSEGCLQSVHLP